jgi:hypothetical protein
MVVLAPSLPAIAQVKLGCNDPSEACATESKETLELRKTKIRELYKDLVYPAPVAIISGSQKVDHIFEQAHVRGRVTPVGQFPGFEAAVEYFYGLASAPGLRVANVTIDSLIAGDDKVAVKVNIFFCQLPDGGCDPTQLNGPSSFTLTQTGFFRFNSDNKIISFDLSIQNLGAAFDPATDAARLKNIQQTCALLTIGFSTEFPATCPTTFDDPSDYPSDFLFNPTLPQPLRAFENCVGYMRQIPYGSWNRANSNTFVCRQIHSLLTPIRPEIHCPHTSPAGGHTCVDFPYSSYYDEEY